jgi:NitT/TauT family transport system ATP-binding protein
MSAVPGPLLEIDNVRKVFPREGGELLALDGVNLRVNEGQILGLLGRSGSGKSTLLRLIAGLSRPSSGSLAYRGAPIDGPPPGIAMVFQSFALFPWLTVYDNVALGLEAQRVPSSEVRKRSLAAIDLIGLDGYESAYPRELSGGMRQRVGFARALVVHPQILLMDEPFSALDVQTRQLMENEVLALWQAKRRAVLFITHDLDEAIAMSDRVVVLSAGPASHPIGDFRIDLPRPRDVAEVRGDARFVDLHRAIWDVLREEVLAGYRQQLEAKKG